MSARHPRHRGLATTLGACGAVLWASETALLSHMDGLPPFQIVALTFAVAAVLTLATNAATGASVPAAAELRKWARAALADRVIHPLGTDTLIQGYVHRSH